MTYRKKKRTENPGRDQKEEKIYKKYLAFKCWQQLFKGIHRMGFNKYF